MATLFDANTDNRHAIAMSNRGTVNPDGVSIKGCNYIYAPKGQAGEYAPLAANPYRGCGTGCAYCYVPLITKQTRKEFDAGAVSRQSYLQHLRNDAVKYMRAGITEQCMFSFTSDVYNPSNTELTRPSIEIIRNHGLAFCVLTKHGPRALVDIDLYRPDRDAFASTLTSLDDAFSRKWERHAALPADRINALEQFHNAGIFTWVSLEPTLDCDASIEIVKATHEFVDLFKIGRVNYLPMTRTTDWKDYTLRICEVANKLGAQHYVKKDLQPFLPAGYHNPLRVPQHH
jgi:DNA repair photolyase